MSQETLDGLLDLSVRARRALLTESGQLDRALARSATLRVAYLTGQDLDNETAVRPGDEELILRAADAALARALPQPQTPEAPQSILRLRPKRKYSWRMTGLIAAAMLASTLAIAEGTGVLPHAWLSRTPMPELQLAIPAVKRQAQARPAKKAEEVPAAPRKVEEAPPAPPPPVSNARSTESSAADLFHKANAARRSGQFKQAKQLYSQLIARHPGSDEAKLARVSLGKLLLAKGNASQAEQEFRQYLRGGGQLAEEALVSRAQSLGRMHRSAEERQAWQQLLSQYPNSVYAAQARQRLSALNRPSTPSGI